MWKKQISENDLADAGAMPQKFYSSPFTRAARTLELTWSDIVLNENNPPRPFVREKYRETIGYHPCDKRGKISVLKENFPFIEVEQGMTEDDELWEADCREDESRGQDPRMRDALDDVFLHDKELFLSVTAHSGCIRSMVRATGHRLFKLYTSKMIPVAVKATLKPEFRNQTLPGKLEVSDHSAS